MSMIKKVIIVCVLISIVYSKSNCFNGLKELEEKHLLSGNQLPKAQWFDQNLDHFNGQEQRMWKQRYFVNDTFFNPSLGGPIFFQIGGEGAISPGYVTFLEMVHYAQKHGALLVALEHRFYGESHPFPQMTTENLRYLNSQQALADAAYFLSSFKAQNGLPEDNPVVSFGCSYPGALAAWFRLKYPHVTIGSVASSAPVEAVVDFYQYLDVVDQSINYFVGKECDELISSATQQVQKLLQSSSGRKTLEKLFNTCEPIVSDNDVSTFMSNLMGDFQGVVQYNNELGPVQTVDNLCSIMINGSSDPLTAYSKVASIFYSPCMDVSYSNLINELRDVDAFGNNSVGMRQWTYQSCNEFGYFQSTDSENQPFGDLVPIKYWVDQCKDIFGIDFNTEERVKETNIHYGAKNYKRNGATNILFVNGNIDPWHALSVTHAVSESVESILIDGTAHCRNIKAPDQYSPPGLIEAQEKTASIINKWLQQ